MNWQQAVGMKITDDYRAKIRLWAQDRRVAPEPAPPELPQFRKQTFRSHAEMNRWKAALLRAHAASIQTHG
jgi:hypothetical protein